MNNLVVLFFLASLFFLSIMYYNSFFKRFWDIILSGIALFLLCPVFIFLTILGAIKMKGNPFFTQLRVGKDEKVFRLIKFRSMTCERDVQGNLLSDDQRLVSYGKLLRSTSLDELPELINIFLGDMSIVGPRPLLTEYLPWYTNEEKIRHYIRPGLTGWAQVNGRNAIDSWEHRFIHDIEYVNNISLLFDIKIILVTIWKVIKRADIQVGSEIKVGRLDDYRRKNVSNNKKI